MFFSLSQFLETFSKIIKINKGNGEFSYISSPDKPYSIELVSDGDFFLSSKENGQIYHYGRMRSLFL